MKSLFRNEIKIYLADDHIILREGLSMVLSTNKNYKIIGQASDGLTAFKEIIKLKPDIAILDISMPQMNGIQLARNLIDTSTRVIILSSYNSKDYIKEALKQKVLAYILKEDAGEELFEAIESAMNNKLFLSKRILENNLKEELTLENNLTSREIEILKLIADGLSNKEISKLLGISGSTSKAHRANLMNKLGIHKATDLVKYAVKNNLI